MEMHIFNQQSLTRWYNLLSFASCRRLNKTVCVCACCEPWGLRRAPSGYLDSNKNKNIKQNLAAISAQVSLRRTTLHGAALHHCTTRPPSSGSPNCLPALCFCHWKQLLQSSYHRPISTNRMRLSPSNQSCAALTYRSSSSLTNQGSAAGISVCITRFSSR